MAHNFTTATAGQRILPDESLREQMQVLNQHRLRLYDVESDLLGRAYEYLLREFAEGMGQSAGKFYTPQKIGVQMACVLEPQPGIIIELILCIIDKHLLTQD